MQNQGDNLPPDYPFWEDMPQNVPFQDEDAYDKYIDDQLSLEAENNL